MLELGRTKRSRMYDLAMDPETPTFLAPCHRRVGVRERLDADQIGRGGDRGRVRAAVDQRDLAEEVARPEGGEMGTGVVFGNSLIEASTSLTLF